MLNFCVNFSENELFLWICKIKSLFLRKVHWAYFLRAAFCKSFRSADLKLVAEPV